MKESKKDKRDHDYGKVHRFMRHIHHNKDLGNFDERYDKIDELFRDYKMDEKTDYVEFCRFLRHNGRSNHSRPNPKHDHPRRMPGYRKMIQKAKEHEIARSEYFESRAPEE